MTGGRDAFSSSGEVGGVVVILSRPPSSDPFDTEDSAVELEASEPGEGALVELELSVVGGGTSSFFFGKNAALISPIPTKNSSIRAV